MRLRVPADRDSGAQRPGRKTRARRLLDNAPESPAHSRRRNREGPASSQGLNSQRGFGPAVEPWRKSRPRSTSLHGSSPCKCQRLSTLRWDRLPPSRPSTKSGARAGGRRLSDRRLHRWLAGTSASAPSSHGAADLLGLNRAHICVRNLNEKWPELEIIAFREAILPSAQIHWVTQYENMAAWADARGVIFQDRGYQDLVQKGQGTFVPQSCNDTLFTNIE